nr:MBL fold metallo-hydrolase [Micromonospora sp. DSM 115978]
MRIVKYTHACVRLEHEGRVLVIDPGTWSEPRALAGADAVLVTHEHTDHIDVLRLAGLGAPVYAPAGARLPNPALPNPGGRPSPSGLADPGELPSPGGLAVTWVRPDTSFVAAGFRVRAVGGRHATIYGGQPDCVNLGYLVEEAVYHPGDALHPPGVPVETLLVPAQASWLKLAEAIAFARAVGAERIFPIHDAQLNERGLASVNGWFSEQTSGYRWLAPGEST